MQRSSHIRPMVCAAICAALMAVCAWISIPAPVPFTLQTFAVFLALGLLGGRWGTVSVLVYILLGAVGAPVFSGFRGGLGALLGPTGGYILGFLLSALLMWGLERYLGRRPPVLILSMVLGLLLCYLFGTLWFMWVYTGGPTTFWGALLTCVIPYIPADALKLAGAVLLTVRLRPHVRL